MEINAGDWVEVRSKEEILDTLDKKGRLEGLPCMPQMFNYCGKRFQVYKNAYKTCDTVSGRYIGLRLDHSVHLSHRCDGKAYGGCQAACLLFWKTAWLKPVNQGSEKSSPLATSGAGCTEEDVLTATSITADGKVIYKCQATTLLEYTRPLKWWDARQYADAISSGNKTPWEVVQGLTFLAYAYGTRASSAKFGAPARWLYNRARVLWGGIQYPRRPDLLTSSRSAPRQDLNLRPGEMVRAKSFEAIMATLDKTGSHLGLKFDAELAPYCGKTYRVMTRVERFVDESTGAMRTLKTPAVILDGVVCKSKFSGQRMFCPREIFGWWRENWLERVQSKDAAPIETKEDSNVEIWETHKKGVRVRPGRATRSKHI